MIIDFHTHIFPPEVREQREEFVRRDPTFAEMYADPQARIATAEDLSASMEAAGVDVSVALGFAWREQEVIARHNDYLLQSADQSDGRIVPFCTINMAADATFVAKEVERCAAGGAGGLGELRPENQGWELNGEAGERLAELAAEYDLLLLFHVTEPGGHEYPGKEGLALGAFYRFQLEHPELRIVGAHLGGGLPMNAPEGQVPVIARHVYFDTAAQPYLYEAAVCARLADGPFAANLLLGSDFPLLSQKRQLTVLRTALQDDDTRAAVMGGNAARLLGLL